MGLVVVMLLLTRFWFVFTFLSSGSLFASQSAVFLESGPLIALFLLSIGVLISFNICSKFASSFGLSFWFFQFSFLIAFLLAIFVVFIELLSRSLHVAVEFILYILQVLVALSLKLQLCLSICMPLSFCSRENIRLVLDHIFCSLGLFVCIEQFSILLQLNLYFVKNRINLLSDKTMHILHNLRLENIRTHVLVQFTGKLFDVFPLFIVAESHSYTWAASSCSSTYSMQVSLRFSWELEV